MNNGKLPLMPTARERMTHKNGCEELYNKLIREMGDGITKESISSFPEVDHRTTDTPKTDVYCKNEDGTETYLGKAVIGSKGTTKK